MKLLESQIRPGTSGVPGSASSLPVDSTTTLGRGRTRTDPRPAAAITATCIGCSRVPAVTSTSPALASSPASRIALPYSALARMLTRALPPSVHSTGTTASAPCGSIAPVMILMAVPGWSAYAPVSPAATSAVTGSVTGFSPVAAATSSTRTAYPSMPELSNEGSGADRGHVLGQHQATDVVQAELGGGQRRDGGEDLGQVLLDRRQLSGMTHRRLSRYLRSQGTISSARSERSQANWTRVRR